MNIQALAVFIFFFVAVSALGFFASRWRSGDLSRLQEWGLAGRRFGSITTWFLLGGDIYTAYSFIAVPGLIFSQGAMGFFAVAYLTIVYPLMFLVLPRFWTIARHRGYLTPADFVRERFDSGGLALLIAITGILATTPYIALQMYGIEVCLAQMGIPLEISLFLAFAVLAISTYVSGLRAPAIMAVVKDLCIWLVVLIALVWITPQLGGFPTIFAAVHLKARLQPNFHDMLLPSDISSYITLSLGSALALFMYPHILTGMLSTNSRKVIRRNAALLPAYTLLVWLIGLLGYVAIAANVKVLPGYGSNSVIPALFAERFPAWFAGFALASIAIGALAPASIMSIAAANLFTRNIYREYIRPACTEQQESRIAKLTSFIVKFGALAFITLLPQQLAINFQLLGGIWINQTLPAVLLGLYTNWFHRRALIIGLLSGLGIGTWMVVIQNFRSSMYLLTLGNIHIPLYAAVAALVVNLLLCILLTWFFKVLGVDSGEDATSPNDYEARPVKRMRQPSLLVLQTSSGEHRLQKPSQRS